MPVTIKVAQHNANPVRDTQSEEDRRSLKSSQNVLERLAFKDKDSIGPILDTAIGAQTSLTDSILEGTRFRVEDHGLVRAAYYAYSGHHHLVIRPEDIWFAVLTQFSFYVNANAEELRSSFVAHEGKRGLILRDPAQPDMGSMCRNMTKLIEENIVDPKLREWILPSFTTTTVNDQVVASVIMMGTLQKYFEYVFDATCCGIPTVTLLGELSDWEDIERRIEKLAEYGEQPTRFRDLLRPVLKYMVASFKNGPDSPGVVDFWSRMIDRNNGSGVDYLSGWMVAFCFWDEDGKCLARSLYGGSKANLAPPLEPLGVVYHTVDFGEVPAGFVSVPVKYLSPQGSKFDTKLLAGFVGFEEKSHVHYNHQTPTPSGKKPTPAEPSSGKLRSVFAAAKQKLGGSSSSSSSKQTQTVTQTQKPLAKSTQDPVPGEAGKVDTLQPLTGWWMYKVKTDKPNDMSRTEFYQERQQVWEGGSSTGYVQRDGQTVKVREGLPSDWNQY